MKMKNKNGWFLMLSNALKASLSQNKCHWTLIWANTYLRMPHYLAITLHFCLVMCALSKVNQHITDQVP